MVATNFIDGVTNVAEASAMGTLVFPDPSRCHTFYDDFDRFNTNYAAATTPAVAINGDWLVTTTGGTTLVTDADGGVVAFTNDGTNSHATYAQWQGCSTSVSETFTWDSARSLWFKSRFKISDATNSALVMGLQITDTTPLAVSDGLFFSKADAAAAVSFTAIKTGAGTTTVSNVATLANDTYVELAFNYLPNGDGMGSALPVCIVYLNDTRVTQITDFTNFPTRTLAISFGAANGAAGTDVVMSTDYILVSKTRPQSWVTP